MPKLIGPIIIHVFEIIIFWDQYNMSIIRLLQHMTKI